MKNPVRLLAISLSILPLVGPITKVEATDSSPTTTVSSVVDVPPPAVENKVQVTSLNARHPELVAQLKSRKGGSIKFWEAVSWCETNHNWKNGGNWSGGLGMAQSVWVNYGGKQFASRPSRASKEEQIIIANRAAFFGFQTKNTFRTLEDKENKKPFFRPAVGWRSMQNWGRGCINWETRKPLRERYTEAGVAEWRKTRPGYKSPSGKVSSQSVSTVKSCPQWESQLKAHGLIPVKKFSYIMWRESRCQEKIVSKPNRNGTRDYGLLQINSSWRTVTRNVCGGTDMNILLNSKCNLKVARYLFNNGGIRHWKSTSGSD